MIFYKCKKYGAIVWFWQNNSTLHLELKNGKEKAIPLCFDCGVTATQKWMEIIQKGGIA